MKETEHPVSSSLAKHIIREASSRDYKNIISIVENVFKYYRLDLIAQQEVPDLLDIETHYTRNGTRLFVAEFKGKCLGCSALHMNNGSTEVKRVYVEPEYWDSGLDLSLVNYSICTAKEYGESCVNHWIDTRFEREQRSFEMLGFVYTGRVRPLFDINKSYEYHYRKTLNGK